MDAKQACDKLNGFNFQNRYLVGTCSLLSTPQLCCAALQYLTSRPTLVLYHQPEKMLKSKEDLEARRESLAQLKQQHGID